MNLVAVRLPDWTLALHVNPVNPVYQSSEYCAPTSLAICFITRLLESHRLIEYPDAL
jgi:hypothetical protein